MLEIALKIAAATDDQPNSSTSFNQPLFFIIYQFFNPFFQHFRKKFVLESCVGNCVEDCGSRHQRRNGFSEGVRCAAGVGAREVEDEAWHNHLAKLRFHKKT